MSVISALSAEGWERPTQVPAGEPLEHARDLLLGMTGVSLDELDEWRALEWLSYDVREIAFMDEAHLYEILFVRDLTRRAGLRRTQVQRFLDQLEPPYRYDTGRVAFSFCHGWVQLPGHTHRSKEEAESSAIESQQKRLED
jgi:hypothetical protein